MCVYTMQAVGARVAAYVHQRGCPRWGPLRTTEAAAIADRLVMLDACKRNTLPQALADLRRSASDAGGLGGLGGLRSRDASGDVLGSPAHAVTAQVNAAHAVADLFD